MKILIIGQAPSAQKQEFPYCTTQLYDWLLAVGISQQQAQEMFEFDAVYNKFPGHDKSGHKKPTEAQMNEYWKSILKEKVEKAEKIWILGKVAFEFVTEKVKYMFRSDQDVLYTIHPSKLNILAFRKNRESIINSIKQFL